MNSIIRNRIAAAIILLTIVAISSKSFAAVDYFLKIEDKDGKSQIVRCPDGSCTVENVAPGTYKVSLVDSKQKAWLPANFKFTLAMKPTDFSASLALRKSGTEPATSLISSASNSTGAATLGLPTGKRMHKPFVITKELDKASPVLFSIVAPTNDSGTGGGDKGVEIKWTITVRVQRIEMN